MEGIKELGKRFAESRKEMDTHQELAIRLGQQIQEAESDVEDGIVEYWLKHGGLDGRYFKTPYHSQWCDVNDPMVNPSGDYNDTHYLYIKRLISVTKGRVTFYGEDVMLMDNGTHSEYSSIGLDIRSTRVNRLHPEYEITQTEFETAVAEWKKRSNEFVEDLLKNRKKRDIISIQEYCEA